MNRFSKRWLVIGINKSKNGIKQNLVFNEAGSRLVFVFNEAGSRLVFVFNEAGSRLVFVFNEAMWRTFLCWYYRFILWYL